MHTNPKSRSARFSPAVLPMEYAPRMAGVAGSEHAHYYLVPGKIFVSPNPYAITAIVGSGISLCLWDPANGIGGANHWLLPTAAPTDAGNHKFGDLANQELLRQLLQLGADLGRLRGKVFGGSEPQVTFGNPQECLGHRNVKTAIHFLGMKGIPLVDTQVGGTHGRKIIFQSHDGQAWSQQL